MLLINSSSSDATSSLCENLGLLKYFLHLTRSWLRFVQLFIFIILKSSLLHLFSHRFCSSCQSCRYLFPFTSFFDHPIVCHSIYMTNPAQPLGSNVINPCSELNYLIIHGSSLSSVSPNILLSAFLSVINNFCFVYSCNTHVSLANIITGPIMVQ